MLRVAMILMLAGCSTTGLDLGEQPTSDRGDAGSLDGGRISDAAEPDARSTDAGDAMDSATRDAEVHDAEVHDAQVHEAGTTDAGCAASLDSDPFACPLQRERVSVDPAGEDAFGTAVAIDGDTLVVGVPGDDSAALGVNGDAFDNTASNSGAVYVFVRRGEAWIQQAYLKADERTVAFGSHVALNGDTLVASSSGAWEPATRALVVVFTRRDGAWRQTATIAPTDTRSDGSAPALALTGDTLVLGETSAPPFALSGVQVYVRDGDNWTEQGVLQPSNSDANDGFGHDVAIAGDTIVVGAPWEASNALGVDGDGTDNSVPNSGAAYVFVRTGTVWAQQAYLKQGEVTGVCFRCDPDGYFGYSVAVTGDTVVVGAPHEESNASGINGTQTDYVSTAIGAAYVFARTGDTWTQQAHVRPSTTHDPNGVVLEAFGAGVAAFDRAFVVGAGILSAAHGLWLFGRSDDRWTERATLDTAESRPIGARVAMSRDTIAVGAPEEVESIGIDTYGAGAAYVFRYSGSRADP